MRFWKWLKESVRRDIESSEETAGAKWNTWRFWQPIYRKEDEDTVRFVLNFNGIAPCFFIATIVFLIWRFL
jgi:hypothetical protein